MNRTTLASLLAVFLLVLPLSTRATVVDYNRSLFASSYTQGDMFNLAVVTADRPASSTVFSLGLRSGSTWIDSNSDIGIPCETLYNSPETYSNMYFGGEGTGILDTNRHLPINEYQEVAIFYYEGVCGEPDTAQGSDILEGDEGTTTIFSIVEGLGSPPGHEIVNYSRLLGESVSPAEYTTADVVSFDAVVSTMPASTTVYTLGIRSGSTWYTTSEEVPGIPCLTGSGYPAAAYRYGYNGIGTEADQGRYLPVGDYNEVAMLYFNGTCGAPEDAVATDILEGDEGTTTIFSIVEP